jgi:hypothetical protein
VLLGLVLTAGGCTHNELTTWSVACHKREDGRWGSLLKDPQLYSRFELVSRSRYRVSFDTQRVISEDQPGYRDPYGHGVTFTDCIVFDARNWSCRDHDGTILKVQGGWYAPNPHCTPGGLCLVQVGVVGHALILLRGHAWVDALCNQYSRVFELLVERAREESARWLRQRRK